MKGLIILVALAFTFNSFGQDTTTILPLDTTSIPHKSDISVIAGIDIVELTTKRIGLQYRTSVSEKWRFKTGLLYNRSKIRTGQFIRFKPLYSGSNKSIAFSDAQNEKHFTGRIGFDYMVTNSFYLGTSVGIGFSKRTRVENYEGKRFNMVQADWDSCDFCMQTALDSDSEIRYSATDPSSTGYSSFTRVETRKYFNIGFEAVVGYELEISDRFSCGIQYNFLGTFHQSNEGHEDYFATNNFVDILFRYRFG